MMAQSERSTIKVEQSSRTSRIAGLVAVIVILAMFSAPAWSNRGTLSILMEFFYFLSLAQLWNLLAGFSGIISLGQQAFLGLGGYVLFFASMRMGWNPVAALLLAGVIGGLVAIPGALVVFRLQGAYLAIGTWVIAEAFKLVFSKITTLGAGSGISLLSSVARSVNFGPLRRDTILYGIALLIALLCTAGCYALLRSQTGLALTAIRDNEATARSAGVNSFRIKLFIFVATGFGTALTGALIYLSKLRISPSAAFDINWTSYMIFIVVIGGVGTLEGPIVGTLVFFFLRQYLSDLGSWYLIILGVVAVAVMLKLPSGLWGTLAKKHNISLFSTQRRIVFDTDDRPIKQS
jgi:branched-chain amino acid transport system permease protein